MTILLDEFQYKKLFRFRIIRLTQLPRKLIEGSENLQVSTLNDNLRYIMLSSHNLSNLSTSSHAIVRLCSFEFTHAGRTTKNVDDHEFEQNCIGLARVRPAYKRETLTP